VEAVPRAEGLRRAIEWERGARAASAPRQLDYAAEDALLTELRTPAPVPIAPPVQPPFAAP
jgi:hypothetical protein